MHGAPQARRVKLVCPDIQAWQKLLGRHLCRTKLPLRNFISIRKNGTKDAKKGPTEATRNVYEQFYAPLLLLKNISPELLKMFHSPKFATKKFTATICRGRHAKQPPEILVAQCSATPASVAATPPCRATPFQRQLDVRHSWPFKVDRCDWAL